MTNRSRRGYFRQNCMWMCLLGLKNWTCSIPIFRTITHPSVYAIFERTLNFAQNGAFYHNLLKIHPIYVIWAPSLMKPLGGGTHMLVCVVIIKQAFKFHPLNTDLEQVKIATLITDQLVKWGPFSLTSGIWASLSLTSCIWTPFSLTYIKKVPLSTDLQKKKKKEV